MDHLLRPPSHRGPLIAAGAVVLTAGVVLQQFRIDDLGDAWQLLITGSLAALFLWLAVGAPLEAGRPPAYQSALIVCGIVQLAPALVHLGRLLGASGGSIPAGLGTWVSAVLAGVAGVIAARRNSGIAAFLSAVAGGLGVIFLSDFLADPGIRTIRWLLLLITVTYALLSVILRGNRPRQSEQLVNAAGLAILWIPLTALAGGFFGELGGFGGSALPGFWELVVVATAFGLIAYAAVDRTPGPAYLGVANLAAFFLLDGLIAERTLQWWPFTLLAAGGLMLAAGLRPARPLPPEPEGYRRDDLPLTARVEGDEQVFTVRD
jgi:hypothetical protein